LRLAFAGTPEFAVPALEALLASDHRVVAVYTQPDRPAGRGRRLTESPVKRVAGSRGLPLEQPVSLRDADAQAALAGLELDALIVAAYGLILPQAVLDIPRLGCINIHASLLPRWRGAAPIQRAIQSGDTVTGITIMQMAAGLDTGDILLQRETSIGGGDTAASLHDRLAVIGAEALIETLEALAAGRIEARPQDEALATYASKIDKRESEIDWNRAAQEIERQIRAFNPWPVAQTRHQGQALRIWAAEALEGEHGEPPGRVLAEGGEGILVAAGRGMVRLLSLQLSGGKVLAVREFLNARSLKGVVLPD
jgi:methionyl-tRNA formyltransferase